jgi:hypothetical protein
MLSPNLTTQQRTTGMFEQGSRPKHDKQGRDLGKLATGSTWQLFHIQMHKVRNRGWSSWFTYLWCVDIDSDR